MDIYTLNSNLDSKKQLSSTVLQLNGCLEKVLNDF